MKKISLITSIGKMTSMMLSSFGGGAFKKVAIGKQVWMTRNLNVDKFRNGDPIPHAQTDEQWQKASENKQPAWCNYEDDPAKGAKYGKLYNWYAVIDSRGLAPVGYHIPSDAEWTELTDFLGGEEFAGSKMKSKSGWSNNGDGTNTSGFTGLPCGFRFIYGYFGSIGEEGFWWSSTEDNANDDCSRYRNLNYDTGRVYVDSNLKQSGYSVRCLKD